MSRKGRVLQSIVQECGGSDRVTISFPRIDIKDSRVALKGLKDAVQLAKRRILEIVKDLVSWRRCLNLQRVAALKPYIFVQFCASTAPCARSVEVSKKKPWNELMRYLLYYFYLKIMLS